MACSSVPTLERIRLTPEQTELTSEQLELLQTFLKEGETSFNKTRITEKISEVTKCDKGTCFVFRQMLVFLWLSQLCPKGFRISPPGEIDAIWHQFILFTKEYHAFCMSTVGRMIHHHPHTSANRAKIAEAPLWDMNFEKLNKLISREVILNERHWENFGRSTRITCVRCDIGH